MLYKDRATLKACVTRGIYCYVSSHVIVIILLATAVPLVMSVLPFLAPIESRFSWEKAQPWLDTSYRWMGCYVSMIYLLLVYVGKRWMRDKPAYSLRRPLAMWNTGLVVFSIIGSLNVVPYLVSSVVSNGFVHSVCNDVLFSSDAPHAILWAFLFLLSKCVELFDTMFVILRKTPLNFLHWYHHATVFMYAAYYSSYIPALSLWFASMNYSVHSIMYSYYTVKAAGVRVPQTVALVITTLQLVQFVVGLVALVTAYAQKTSGVNCDATYGFLYVGLTVYLSYLVLFLHYFCQRYMRREKP